jgi:hypothetical protein
MTTWPDELTVATFESELLKLNVPLLEDVGGVGANCASPNVFAATAKVPKLGAGRVTVSVAVMLEDTYSVVALCVATIFVFPTPTNVISPEAEFTVAAAVFELI